MKFYEDNRIKDPNKDLYEFSDFEFNYLEKLLSLNPNLDALEVLNKFNELKADECIKGTSYSAACIDSSETCRINVEGESKNVLNSMKKVIDFLNKDIKEFLPKKKKFNPDISLNEKVLNKLREKEKEIANLEIEKGILIDKNGDVVAEKLTNEENKFSVDLTDELNQFTTKELNDIILTHNHPGEKIQSKYDPNKVYEMDGGSFSGDDLRVAAARKLNGIRAVSKEYEHSLYAGEDGWPDHNLLKSNYNDLLNLNHDLVPDKIDEYFENLKNNNKKEYDKFQNSSDKEKDLKIEELLIQFVEENHHLTMIDIAEEFGLEYDRAER